MNIFARNTNFALPLLAVFLVGASTTSWAQADIFAGLYALDTPNYTGGLTPHDREVAEEIVGQLRPRLPAIECDFDNPDQGQIVSLGDDGGQSVSLDDMDPGLAELVRALDYPSREVRDVAAYTIGLIGPAAIDAEPILGEKFSARFNSGEAVRNDKSGWYNFAYENVICDRVVAADFREAIPPELLPPQERWNEFLSAAAVLMAELYLEPDIEYPPGMMGYTYGNYPIADQAGDAVPLLAQILVDPQLGLQKRLEAAQALSRLERDILGPALPQLLEAADYADNELKYFVMEALVVLENERAIPLLIERIRGNDYGSWQRDLCVYGPKATAAEDRLVEVAMTGESYFARQSAIETLGCIESTLAVPTLVAILGEPDWELAESALSALGMIGDARSEVISALTDVYENYWSVHVRREAWMALTALGQNLPEPMSYYGGWPDEPPDNPRYIVVGGGADSNDHGLPWCNEEGRYSVDGENWFYVGWTVAEYEPVPDGFPEEGEYYTQDIGTQTFLPVDDGWIMGSLGFEGLGVLMHVSEDGKTSWIGEEASSVTGVVRSGDRIFAYSTQLYEIKQDDAGNWTRDWILALPSEAWAHAIAPDGHLLLSDGANAYAIVDNNISPLKCEMIFEESYFEKRKREREAAWGRQ